MNLEKELEFFLVVGKKGKRFEKQGFADTTYENTPKDLVKSSIIARVSARSDIKEDEEETFYLLFKGHEIYDRLLDSYREQTGDSDIDFIPVESQVCKNLIKSYSAVKGDVLSADFRGPVRGPTQHSWHST